MSTLFARLRRQFASPNPRLAPEWLDSAVAPDGREFVIRASPRYGWGLIRGLPFPWRLLIRRVEDDPIGRPVYREVIAADVDPEAKVAEVAVDIRRGRLDPELKPS